MLFVKQQLLRSYARCWNTRRRSPAGTRLVPLFHSPGPFVHCWEKVASSHLPSSTAACSMNALPAGHLTTARVPYPRVRRVIWSRRLSRLRCSVQDFLVFSSSSFSRSISSRADVPFSPLPLEGRETITTRDNNTLTARQVHCLPFFLECADSAGTV